MDNKAMVAQMMNNKVAELYGAETKDRIDKEDVVKLQPSQFEKDNGIDHEIYMARFRTVIIRVTVYKAGNYRVDIVL